MTNPNDLIYPFNKHSGDCVCGCNSGLTKREYFAAMAMLGMRLNIITGDGEQWKKRIPHIQSAVACCVEIADFLIVELSK